MKLAIHPDCRRTRGLASVGRTSLSRARCLSLLVLSSCLIALPAAAQSIQRAPAAPTGAAGASPPPAGPLGVWLDDTGRGAVEIKACGNNLCGHIYWLQEPLAANGQPVTDGHNPDASKRSRPVCGLQVIGNVRPLPNGTWDEGWVYDPKVGKAYDVAMALDKKDRLNVTGYKGVKFLSKNFIWTRAPADLPRCDQVTAEKAPAATGGPAARSSQPGQPAAGAQKGVQPAARPAATPPPTQARQ